MQTVLAWWEFDELLEHFRSRPDIWTADGDLWVRYSDAETQVPLLAVQTVPPTSDSRFRTGVIIATPLGVTQEEMESYITSLLVGHTSYAERVDAARFLSSELNVDVQVAEKAATILAYLFLIGPLDPKLSKETWKGFELKSPDSGQFLGQWAIRRGDLPGGCIRMYTTGHELVRVFLSLNGPIEKNMMGFSVQEFTGHLRPIGRSVKQLPEVLFNEVNHA